MKLLMIGCGKMGKAILEGLSLRLEAQDEVLVIKRHNDEALAKQYGIKIIQASTPLPDDFIPDIVILAIKPQMTSDILPNMQRYIPSGSLVISVIAGKTLQYFSQYFHDMAVVRSMPNLPSVIGQGVTVCCANSLATKEQKSLIEYIFNAIGTTHWIEEEKLMDAVTAISGSGPAYVFHFIHCFIEAAKALGLPEALATSLVQQTVKGSSLIAYGAKTTPHQLKDQVRSAKGTTDAALNVLETGEFESLIKNATFAAKKRSEELRD